jgi:hypothetical protein
MEGAKEEESHKGLLTQKNVHAHVCMTQSSIVKNVWNHSYVGNALLSV